MLEILYKDEYYVVINKPNGLLTHRTPWDKEETSFALQLLRDQLGGDFIFPVHRLDRPTSGVLLFAFNKDAAAKMANIWKDDSTKKSYIALVRGHLTQSLELTRDVLNERGNEVSAHTTVIPLKTIELPLMIDRYPTSRFSIVECVLHSGRWHQIRQHLAQERFYIINDRVHGNNKYNRYFKNELNIEPLFLHAKSLQFIHPITKEFVEVTAPAPEHWHASILM